LNITKKSIEERNKLLVECKDTYIVYDFLNKLKSQFSGYTLSTYYSVDDFMEDIHRGNLFNSNNKIIVLMNLDSDNLKIVNTVIESNTADIIVFVEQKAISKTKLYTNFKANCNNIKLSAPTEKECLDWVKGEMNAKKMLYDRLVPDLIVNRKGANLSALNNEIRKLFILYDNKYISIKDCDIILNLSESKFYTIVEQFMTKDINKFMKEFDKLDDYSYIKLIYTFINYIEKLYKVASFKEQGKNLEEISELTGINKFFLRTKYNAILAVFNKIKLIKFLEILNDLDFQLRQNTLSHKLLVESYLFKAFKL